MKGQQKETVQYWTYQEESNFSLKHLVPYNPFCMNLLKAN